MVIAMLAALTPHGFHKEIISLLVGQDARNRLPHQACHWGCQNFSEFRIRLFNEAIGYHHQPKRDGIEKGRFLLEQIDEGLETRPGCQMLLSVATIRNVLKGGDHNPPMAGLIQTAAEQ